jgi:predicted transcriptional regulator
VVFLKLMDLTLTKAVTEKQLTDKINNSAKVRIKKIAGVDKEVIIGTVTRQDIVDLLALKNPQNKAQKHKVVSEFFESLNPDVITDETKSKILADLDSYE